MRISILSNLYPPYSLGGYEILCENVVEKLRSYGHSVDVLTSTHGVRHPEEDDGISRTLQLYAPFSRKAGMERKNRKKTYFHNYQTAKQHLEVFKPDVTFVWSQLRLTTGAAKAAQDLNIPIAYTFNDYHIHSYLPSATLCSPKKAVRTLLDNTVDRVITTHNLDLSHSTCISVHLKEQLLKQGVPIEPSEIIYQGIPLELFPMKTPEQMLGHSPVRLLYTGQLHEYKGPHLCIDALSKLHSENPNAYQLSVLGDGSESYVADLHACAKELDQEGRISFSGPISRKLLGEHYRDSDILLMTSLWDEPFGLTHLEAMASGTPVISTFRGGMKEFLVHEKNCLIFDPEKPNDLAKQIVRLSSQPGLRELIIKNARDMVEKQFSIESYARNCTDFLQRTIKEAGCS